MGADGIRSTVRQQALPDVTPLYAGYSAWRALIAENAIPPDVHRELFESMSFGLPPGEQFLGYPVAGPDNDLRPGKRRYNVVWYRPADEHTKLPWLLTDESGRDARDFDSAAADPARSHRGNARRRRTAAGAAVPADRAVDRGADPAADLRSGIAAHGDSAAWRSSATRLSLRGPHVAAGVSKAADDAAALAERAAGGKRCRDAALKRFEAARLPENFRIIERARHLGAYLQATQTQEEQCARRRHATAGAVIAETAVLDFLYA